jgi:hypothetical protein
VTTGQIYKGSIAFIILQLIMVAVVISMPKLVMGGIDQGVKIDADKALQEMKMPEREEAPTPPASLEPAKPGDPAASTPTAGSDADDAMKAVQDALKKESDANKKP